MKEFEVIAYQTTRYTMTVNAKDKTEARNIADGIEVISDKWDQDCEYYDFEIVDAEEIKEE